MIPRKDWRGVGSYGTIGLEVVLCMLAGLFGGRFLDGRLGTEPYLAVVGFFFGVAAGGKAIWRGWKQMQADTEREEREQGNPEPLPDPEADDDEGEDKAEDAGSADDPAPGAPSLDETAPADHPEPRRPDVEPRR